MHIVEAARLGADICTCPAAVIDQLFKHPLTDIGLEKFLKDWEKAQAVRAMDLMKHLEELERRAELGGGEDRLRSSTTPAS